MKKIIGSVLVLAAVALSAGPVLADHVLQFPALLLGQRQGRGRHPWAEREQRLVRDRPGGLPAEVTLVPGEARDPGLPDCLGRPRQSLRWLWCQCLVSEILTRCRVDSYARPDSPNPLISPFEKEDAGGFMSA